MLFRSRQDYDLSAHSRDVSEADLSRLRLEPNSDSTAKLDYFDEQAVDPATGRKGLRYIPYVIEPSAGATRATLAFLCEAYNEEFVTQPADEAIAPLREAISASRKSIDKKSAAASKAADTDEGPTLAQLSALQQALEAAERELPHSVLSIEDICDMPGGNRIELLKKVRQAANKLADEHTRLVLRLHPDRKSVV